MRLIRLALLSGVLVCQLRQATARSRALARQRRSDWDAWELQMRLPEPQQPSR